MRTPSTFCKHFGRTLRGAQGYSWERRQYDSTLQAGVILDAARTVDRVHRFSEPFCPGCFRRTSWVLADSAGADDASDSGVRADRGPGAGLALGVDRGGAICGRLLVVCRVGRVAPHTACNAADLDSYDRWPGLCHRRIVSGQLVKTGRLACPTRSLN